MVSLFYHHTCTSSCRRSLHRSFSYRRHSMNETGYCPRWAESVESGALRAPDLPIQVIDIHTCIGSSACVGACPEHATRLVSGTTGLVDQDHSIGPDACEAAYPIEAIQPGFRTENCRVDLPFGTPAVATNAPGIFLAGKLG